MELKNLVPSIFNRSRITPTGRPADPFASLQQEMNRIFVDFIQESETDEFPGSGAISRVFQPSIDVAETDSEIKVRAELPGMEEKDIEVLIADDRLTIKGEKRQQKETKTEQHYHVECSYGSFQRVIPMPGLVEHEQAQAQFKNGVLNVTLPKKQEILAKERKIAIKKG